MKIKKSLNGLLFYRMYMSKGTRIRPNKIDTETKLVANSLSRFSNDENTDRKSVVRERV